jgi:adenylate cyclase
MTDASPPTRRLAAILAADVVGYSRLMGDDEERTVARLRVLFREVVQPAVTAQRGRVFKLMGDAFLAEFGSAVGAVTCAAALQEALAAARDEPPIVLRIGLHLGDVLVEGGDLLGDGVNIAARIEGVAEPGGVALSGAVAEAVRGRVPFGLEDLGEKALKNIERPLRVFRLVTKSAVAAPLLVAAEPTLTLPDKPSLVVLPFQNMSGDAEQDYFVDGLVEDITTALSRLKWFFVISRNSAFTYKGRAVDVRKVGRELGVRYVLQGSVRKAAGHLRITGQLIEAENGRHIWADRFDGTLEDVFDLQDRVTEAVAGAIEPSLRAAEIELAGRKSIGRLGTQDLYWRALPLIWRMEREASAKAMQLLRQALALDPQFAHAQAIGAWFQVVRQTQGWTSPEDIVEGEAMARACLAQANGDPFVLARGAQALAVLCGDLACSREAAERALALCSTSAQVVAAAAYVFNVDNAPERAIPLFNLAVRLSPLDPQLGWFIGGQAMSYLLADDATTALGLATRSLALAPRWVLAHRVRVAALWLLGREEDARQAAAALLTVSPTASSRFTRNYRDQERMQRLRDIWHAAGLPE